MSHDPIDDLYEIEEFVYHHPGADKRDELTRLYYLRFLYTCALDGWKLRVIDTSNGVITVEVRKYVPDVNVMLISNALLW